MHGFIVYGKEGLPFAWDLSLENSAEILIMFSLAASFEPLAHHRNVTSISLFCRCYIGRGSSELPQLIPLPFSCGRSTCYSDKLHDFSVTNPRCYKDVYVNSFFPHTTRHWNSLPMECFSLPYNLNGFKSRINRHL